MEVEGQRSSEGSGGALTTRRYHGHGDSGEAGPWSHHPSKLEGGKGKGPERDGAEGDPGCGVREQTSQGSSHETARQLDPVAKRPRKIPQLE